MREAVIIDAVRTPVGKFGGALGKVRPDDLAALCIAELVERNRLDASLVEDVILGCTNQAGEDNRNVARMAALLAGLPHSVGGQTINRLCGSGLNAVNAAALAIKAGEGDVFIAGGTESMTRAPFVFAKADSPFSRDMKVFDSTIGWRFTNPRMTEPYAKEGMGDTAENVAQRYGITRQEQDEFALVTQRKWSAAHAAGKFADELVPVPVPQRKGEPLIVDRDEFPRPDVTMEQLGKLPAAFKKDGTVTAGNSSGINDGAAAVLLMEAERARQLGYRPLVRVVSSAVAGCDPSYMGLGPIPAIRKALERARLSIDDIDLFELNEAFAAQAIPCIRELGIDPDRVNVNGGSIAIGHPLGSTGARITATLVHEMRRRGSRYGLASLCIGLGQGIATIVERV
ncbi:acetyl-CoA C-acyltransferase [Geomonas subterranea]|uniref:acetyl-CoA C-acyltransferase n=1 Tax=Geomonas subterranea TaxID=2847989 RepID=A0ABX8LJ04_9BACT|nr:acetyl-CoA C-acyltransferase [Geomonas subterranea]QXE91316.1 acetyl-CoA C-acyltransferase [Geomonas subterranea]QXM10597.1 acetyl-CoA C-acyltransferase [Geomonas subterranea]